MLHKFKISNHALITLVILLLTFIGIPIYLIFHSGGAVDNFQSRMLFSDSAKGQMYITDKDGKQLSKANFPKFSYPTVQASSAGGTLLVALNVNSDGETLLALQNGAVRQLSDGAIKSLANSVVVGASHQWFFIDESKVLTVSCPDANTSCLLVSVDLGTGDSKQIVDIGLKQTNKVFPEVYLLGYSPGSHLAYLRVNGDNKLGKTSSAVYQIDINSGKVKSSNSIPNSTGYAITLSPNFAKLAYQVADASNKTTIHILDLGSNKDQSLGFNLGNLPSNPSAFAWSPDSHKILLQTQTVIVPSSANTKPTPIKMAYINVTDNKIVSLRQIGDPAREILVNQGWLDNNTVIYQDKTTSKAGDFSGATTKTARQNISSNNIHDLKTPAADLTQVYQVTK